MPVIPPEPLPVAAIERSYQPAWDILPTDVTERPGYGLYSYVLIADRPQTADEIDTALHVIERLLYIADPLAAAVAQNQPSELNVFFFPTTRSDSRGRTSREIAKWILDNYDHVRAKRILSRLHEQRRGPYIVTAARPLTRASHANARVMVQVLTRPRRTYLKDWVDFFVQRASKPTAWDATSLHQVLLETRDHLESVGAILPEVGSDVEKIVKWVREAV